MSETLEQKLSDVKWNNPETSLAEFSQEEQQIFRRISDEITNQMDYQIWNVAQDINRYKREAQSLKRNKK